MGSFDDYGTPVSHSKYQSPPEQALDYFSERVPVGHWPGSTPISIDINVRRGVWVTGHVLDKTTGKPVSARVEYHVFKDNPHVKKDLRPIDRWPGYSTRDDGTFQLLAYPGSGVLAVRRENDHYAIAVGLDTIKDKGNEWYRHVYPSMSRPIGYHVINVIDPAPGVSNLTHDLLLEPADRSP